MRLRHTRSSTLVVLLMLGAGGVAAQDFDECGVLVQDVECVLFRATNGQQFLLDDVGEFEVGDEVRVTGVKDVACLTTCQNVSGCVEVVRIGYCDGEVAACGTLVQGVECVLFEDDKGFLFQVENTGAFRVGDRVRIRGQFEQDCVTICQQVQGCFRDNTITAASPGSCDDSGGSPVCPAASLAAITLAAAGLLRRRC